MGRMRNHCPSQSFFVFSGPIVQGWKVFSSTTGACKHRKGTDGETSEPQVLAGGPLCFVLALLEACATLGTGFNIIPVFAKTECTAKQFLC